MRCCAGTALHTAPRCIGTGLQPNFLGLPSHQLCAAGPAATPVVSSLAFKQGALRGAAGLAPTTAAASHGAAEPTRH